MTRLSWKLLGLFYVAIWVLTACVMSKEVLHGDILVQGASIVEVGKGMVSAPSNILVRDGRIVYVGVVGGEDVELNADSVVDATGLYLIPGLIDVHAHIGHGGLAENTPKDRELALEQFVRYGVTTIFVPGGGGGNDEQLVEWKTRCGAGELLCPRVLGSGNIITAYGSHPITTGWGLPADVDPDIVHARGAVAVREEDSVAPIIKYKSELGVDAIKIVVEDGPGPFAPKPKLSLKKIREVVEEANAHHLKVFAHVSLAHHVDDVVAAGADGIMHSSENRISDQTLAAMAENEMFYVATLALYDGFTDQAFGRRNQDSYAVAGVSEKALSSFDNEEYWADPVDSPAEAEAFSAAIADNLRRAHDLGVTIALGTDVNNPQVFPGYSAHEELVLMVEAGLTPQAALSAGTSGAASFLGLSEELGKIRAGFRADMLALRGNPLVDVANSRSIEFLLLDGSMISDVVTSN